MIRAETLAAVASAPSKKRKGVFLCFVLVRCHRSITCSVSPRFCCSRLAEHLEQEPARKKAAAEAQRAKLEALERRLGIDASGAGSSSNGDPTQIVGRKHRFDDNEYLEQSRELVDNVKSAVTAGQFSFLRYLFFFPAFSFSIGILAFHHYSPISPPYLQVFAKSVKKQRWIKTCQSPNQRLKDHLRDNRRRRKYRPPV
jgi:hypothetical protein